HPDAKKAVLEQMMREAGVTFLPHSLAFAARTEGGSVTSLLVTRPGGTVELEAPSWVDATGDGDLCAFAGAAFRLGRPGDGLLHAYSQSSGRLVEGERQVEVKMGGVNYDAGWVDPTD